MSMKASLQVPSKISPNGLIRSLDLAGLNHVGVVSVSVYDKTAKAELQSKIIAPGARSILVFASGGAALWRALLADLRENHTHLTDEAHPLDAFVYRAVDSAKLANDIKDGTWFYPAGDAKVHVDFRSLAVAAGLGTPSRLGLVIHPRWGPWIGLRAAWFTPLDLAPSKPVEPVCTGCAAPCLDACPGSAFVGGQWDVQRCSDFHQRSALCAQSCGSRMACPVGASERYPELELLYHYDRKTGRKALAKALGIGADQKHQGVGPLWGAWASGSGAKDAKAD